jgi:16S rRNA (guanine966-N2)-methyltransferase
VRIIGGAWRGRKLLVPAIPGLRPTPDRVRETLFNWLQLELPAARCLDLFAGSGALGFEAASRGAREVVMVESEPVAVHLLRDAAQRMEAGQRVRVIHADALHWLREAPLPFDIVFLDPPYGSDLLQPAIAGLEHGGGLAAHARIYFECAAAGLSPELPPGWRVRREKRAGQVRYALAERHPTLA